MIGRIFRIVRTPITLLILLGVLLLRRLVGLHEHARPYRRRRRPRASTRGDKGQLQVQPGHRQIYNGGDRKGLAADVGRALREQGFKVMPTANTGEKIQKTVIVGADANTRGAVGEERSSRTSSSGRQAGRPLGRRPGRQQVRRIQQEGEDHLRVKTSTVCLPSQQSPTPPPN